MFVVLPIYVSIWFDEFFMSQDLNIAKSRNQERFCPNVWCPLGGQTNQNFIHIFAYFIRKRDTYLLWDNILEIVQLLSGADEMESYFKEIDLQVIVIIATIFQLKLACSKNLQDHF